MIKRIMEVSGHSKKQFAKQIQVSITTIDKWLAGAYKPSKENQDKIRLKYKPTIAKLYK